MVGAQQAQSRNGEKVRRQARRVEGEARLRRVGEQLRDASPTRLVNRCSMSGRATGICASSALALTFREAALNGLIPSGEGELVIL
jgi:ribosomal protein S14